MATAFAALDGCRYSAVKLPLKQGRPLRGPNTSGPLRQPASNCARWPELPDASWCLLTTRNEMIRMLPWIFATLSLIEPHVARATCLWDESTQLSARQVRSRIASKPQINAPLLWRSMRIVNAAVVLRVLVDETGNIGCIHAEQGHPIILSAAFDSIQSWKFRPLRVDRRPRAFSGPLALRISYRERQLAVEVLKDWPKSVRSTPAFLIPRFPPALP